MDAKEASGFLRRVADLEYLGRFPETVAGLREVADLLVRMQLSPLAQSILTVITESTKPPRGSCIAGWHICDQLGVPRDQLDYIIPGTEYDEALKELMEAGLVEELPGLGCRYRIKKG